ncbi:MAG: hypothetical protein A2Y61_02535 [Chloroflexi bacterium RBG_13_60_13]|nr:MAG: hypothetical protein A2Y61_02535 [Chloroflexi bacterium RBG_13_60_13]
MAGNLQRALGRMGELAPEVTSGPILGRASLAKQSQYPSGPEMEFDTLKRQLIDLAYIQSGKQINKQELELKLNSLVNRAKGNLPEQVRLAREYVNRALEPYVRSGAVSPAGGGEQTATFGGIQYRLKYGADPKLKSSWEPIR